MRVMVDMDPRDVWRIQAEAERRGVSPGDVLREVVATRRDAAVMRERVRGMVVDGMCDADIAEEFRVPPGRIAVIRRGLGLPANRRYPARHSTASGVSAA